MMEAHHMMNFHHMMELHYVMGNSSNQFQLCTALCTEGYTFIQLPWWAWWNGEATVCGKHRLADLGDDQYGLDHPAAAADGDPSCFWDLQQLFLANWCLQVGGAVQLLPLLQLQEEAVTAPEHLPQQQQHHLLLMYQFCNSHRTYNTVAKETFLPQQLKKWKCTPIKLFDIIKVANDFCKSSNFWIN